MKRVICLLLVLSLLFITGCSTTPQEDAATDDVVTGQLVPDADQDQPEEPKEPTDTKEPQDSEEPEDTKKPEDTQKPEDTKEPEETKKPEDTKEPAESHTHDWEKATCTAPKTCKTCGATEGEPKEHKKVAATCEKGEHCSLCGKEFSAALGHKFVNTNCQNCDATITIPFELKYEKNMHCYDKTFYIVSLDVLDPDLMAENKTVVEITIQSNTGGAFYFTVSAFDKNGIMISDKTIDANSIPGQNQTFNYNVPANAASISLNSV